jgi:prolyl-tRNA synthetase
VMGSYGIGIGRLLACIAEQHHDDAGLVWPITVAPYPVHLVLLAGRGSNETAEIAERLYSELESAGIQAFYDDRLESPGVKFNDADLIGLPIRLTVSDRAMKAGGVEFKRRARIEREVIPFESVVQRTKLEILALTAEIEQAVSRIE